MNYPVIVEISVVPMGTADPSVGTYVANVEKVLEKYSGIKHMLTPMSTILEGGLDEILKAVREMHEAPFLNGAKRVNTNVSIDDRRDKQGSMEEKVKSVEEKMGSPRHTSAQPEHSTKMSGNRMPAEETGDDIVNVRSQSLDEIENENPGDLKKENPWDEKSEPVSPENIKDQGHEGR